MPRRRTDRFASPLALAAIAALGWPAGLEARDIAGSLGYPERVALPDKAVAVIELRDASGRVVVATRLPTQGRQVPIAFRLTDAPDGVLSLTGAVFVAGTAIRVTDPLPVAAGSAAVDVGDLRLYPHLPLGFASTLRCGTRTVQLGFVDDAARLRLGHQVITLLPEPVASGARFAAADDPETWVWTRGDSATVSLAGHELPECVPAAAGLFLPVTAQGPDRGAGWSARIGRDGLRVSLPGGIVHDGPLPEARPVADSLGAVTAWRFETDELAVTLQDRVCGQPGRLPQPLAVVIEAGGDTLTGCAGDPRDLLADGDWTVTALDGDRVDPGLGVSLSFGPDRIFGHGGCNRYSGGLILNGDRLSVAGIAATRRACPGPRMQIEGRFFGLLGQVAGFQLDGEGRLHLTDAAGAVLITAQR